MISKYYRIYVGCRDDLGFLSRMRPKKGRRGATRKTPPAWPPFFKGAGFSTVALGSARKAS
jgi:hypothetical protein